MKKDNHWIFTFITRL